MFFSKKKLKLCIIIGFIFCAPILIQAAWSNSENFFIESQYDLYKRDQLETQLLKVTNQYYIYVDTLWYQNLNTKQEFNDKIYNLITNFEYKTYPLLTSLFGYEDIPGIDDDSRLILVLEPLKDQFGGYIRVVDKDSQEIAKYSNEGQIIYFNSDLILKSPLEILNYQLAHEFMHLVSLNKKPEAETWFYEFMSEYAGQLVMVDSSTVTQQRAQGLLYSTEVNLIHWDNSDKDYSKVYLLGLYLKEQFGDEIITKILKYPSSNGLISFLDIFREYQLDFEQIFLNWMITNIVNDCSLGKEYCYQNPNLRNYFVFPYPYYIPDKEKDLILVTNSFKPWTANLQRINNVQGDIKLKFTIPKETPIKKIPYIIESVGNNKTLGFLDFSNKNIQEIIIKNMGNENRTIYFIPFIDSSGEQGKTYYYSWEISSIELAEKKEEDKIQKLLREIEKLERQIAFLEMQLTVYEEGFYCPAFFCDLYYGMKNEQVKCLQQFLANLDNQIYPEKLITGYYGPLTFAAVKRFQSYNGINSTGYFGPITRNIVNKNL